MVFEKTPGEVQELLPVPIKELGLKLEGSPIERYVEQLFKELEAKGLSISAPRSTSRANGVARPRSR